MTVAEAMTMCCARGWQGFNADWVQRGARGSGSPSRHNRFDAPGYYDDVTDNTNQQGNLV
jgi:hypothetical protein